MKVMSHVVYRLLFGGLIIQAELLIYFYLLAFDLKDFIFSYGFSFLLLTGINIITLLFDSTIIVSIDCFNGKIWLIFLYLLDH